MSAREWKPGDVAIADGSRVMRTNAGWLYASPGAEVVYTHAERSSADQITRLARPVVVIDPEDREQVERLQWLYVNACAPGVNIADALQAALREFANPMPPEPGVWSVVIVADNTPFLRIAEDHITSPHGQCWFGEHPTTGERVRLTWAELHDFGDVRVVNEGASA